MLDRPGPASVNILGSKRLVDELLIRGKRVGDFSGDCLRHAYFSFVLLTPSCSPSLAPRRILKRRRCNKCLLKSRLMKVSAAPTFGFRQRQVVTHPIEVGVNFQRSAKANGRLAVLAKRHVAESLPG